TSRTELSGPTASRFPRPFTPAELPGTWVGREGNRAIVKLLCATLGCLLSFSSLAGQPKSNSHVPTINVTVRLVNVSVNVTDDKGAPVPGLNKEDFELQEDGHAQKI